jgi:hypothetical protein
MTTFAQLKTSATRAGYTRRVIIECGDADYYGWIRPAQRFGDTDTVTLIEDEGGKIRNFTGADVNVRDLDD